MPSGWSSRRLKKLAKRIPDERFVRGILRTLQNRHTVSDYPVAIVGSSMIERALRIAILSRFIPLQADEENKLFEFDQKGPIADLAMRIRIARALGLFGTNTFQDLEKIRHIRNLFAHSPDIITFAEKDITEACAFFHALQTASPDTTWTGTPKGNYIGACLAISSRLRARILETAGLGALAAFPRFIPELS
jgi:DNA-binding MltR family transcriptional regulator